MRAFRKIGYTVARKTMAILELSPIPNHKINSGNNANGGTCRKNSIIPDESIRMR